MPPRWFFVWVVAINLMAFIAMGLDKRHVFGLAMALFEFPSGYLADRMGYRRAMILASVLNAVGWSIYVRADSIPHILLAEVVLGIGISLISGTDSALLYESLVETKREGEFGHWNGRVRFFGQLGEGSAAIIAGVLYAYWHRLPFVLEEPCLSRQNKNVFVSPLI